MNTKPIPAVLALSASGISCLISIFQGADFKTFVIRFALAAGLFYLIGCFVRVFMDRAFKVDKEETEKTEGADKDTEEGPEQKEDVKTDEAASGARGEDTPPEDQG